MRLEQKIVAVGAVSGAVGMGAGLWLLSRILPAPQISDTPGERLAYGFRANVVALTPLFLMLVTIANSRFLSDAIDPTRNAESASMNIDGRVADNTLQQNFVFALASLAMSTVVSLQQLQVVWACAIVFVVGRVTFWVGYRINPLYRAPGMAATLYTNLGMILYVVYSTFAR